MLVNHRNHPEKVFQAAHKSRDCTQSIWITFSVFLLFSPREKKEET